MRSPRCKSSIRDTISDLNGPPSSLSEWLDLDGGSNDVGVLGIATVPGVPGRIEYSKGSDALGPGLGRADC